MKQKRFSLRSTFIFIAVQLAWLALLGLWIYWYISNYIILTEVGEMISAQFVLSSSNIAILVGGLVLLIAISVGFSVIFGNLSHQMKITKMYDNFIANVTHELKSPLASIQLYLETLTTRRISKAKREEFVQLMTKDAIRLNNLINAILEVAGLEEKRTVYQLRLFQADILIHSLVRDALEQYRVPENAVEIVGNAPANCQADRNALRVVFNNLIDNAVKYSSGPLYITVTLGCTGKIVFAEIEDRGIGIPHRYLKDVFKKFRRVPNPLSPNVQGTGLGLYWVREILNHHRGRISVRSNGENMGSTFRLELPVWRDAHSRRRRRQVASHDMGDQDEF
jgi:signal transduction histidine kinase